MLLKCGMTKPNKLWQDLNKTKLWHTLLPFSRGPVLCDFSQAR